MIRESLAANARNAFMFVTPGGGRAFQRRSSTGGSTTRTLGARGHGAGLAAPRQAGEPVHRLPVGERHVLDGDRQRHHQHGVVGVRRPGGGQSRRLDAGHRDVHRMSRSPAGRPTTALPGAVDQSRYWQPCARRVGVGDRRHVHRRRRRRGHLGHVRSVSVRLSAAAGRRRGHRAGRLAAVRRSVVEGRRHDSRNADGRFAACVHDGRHGHSRVGQFQRRIETGGTSYQLSHVPRPVRRQAGFASSARAISSARYRSTDGTTWSLVGHGHHHDGSTVYVGLAVTSHNTSAQPRPRRSPT